METIHASCVELNGAGLLLRGPSGAGKSDLALRLIDQGARLVADDRVRLEVQDGRLFARAAPSLAGKIEVRGLGIERLDHTPRVALALVVDLVGPEEVERLPEREGLTLLGIALPLLRLWAFEPSVTAKLRLAMVATPARRNLAGRGA
ncbi:MAG: HPr kinase/phosphatase C-terminal domain-containing protein [Proteobacteria bacterium]|nr:HPr kinase/phosphatase C-terminal domain-containing protein [Pseudomonadota bacterium]